MTQIVQLLVVPQGLLQLSARVKLQKDETYDSYMFLDQNRCLMNRDNRYNQSGTINKLKLNQNKYLYTRRKLKTKF